MDSESKLRSEMQKRPRAVVYARVYVIVFVVSFLSFAVLGVLYEHIVDARLDIISEGQAHSVTSPAAFMESGTQVGWDSNNAITFSSSVNGSVSEHDEMSMPIRVSIPSVGIDFVVVNPTESDVETLDAALLKGVVRYPDSGTLADNRPMFLFGHNSHLPVVHNKAFQAFNNLEKVSIGDAIIVRGADAEYHYHVRSITLADAEVIRVPLNGSSKTLTLSTCNNFGEKQERFVVTADFVGSYSFVN